MLVVHPASCCDVCLDLYSISSGIAHSPHAIACGHVFCLKCIRSLFPRACPLCREPFQLGRVKRLYLDNPPRRNDVEQDSINDGHASLLRRMSLVSGEDTPNVEVVKVVTEVQEWLQSQSGNPNSPMPLRYALASLQRCKVLQDQVKREGVEYCHIREQLEYLDTRMRRGQAIAFSLIFFFSIIELTISAWLVSHFNAHYNYLNLTERAYTRFLLFTSTCTIVFSGHRIILFVPLPDSNNFFLSLTFVFWIMGVATHTITGALDGVLNRNTQSVFTHCYQHALKVFSWTTITGALDGMLNPNTQSVFAYCCQHIALEVFPWVILVLLTFAIFATHIRQIRATI